MHDYMKALHARFCREPELQKVRAELDRAYREIKAKLVQQDQETLLQLTDLENELREEEEKRATDRAKMRCPQVKI